VVAREKAGETVCLQEDCCARAEIVGAKVMKRYELSTYLSNCFQIQAKSINFAQKLRFKFHI
jgi:hypothetical protein